MAEITPGTPEAAAAIRSAALRVVEALDDLAPLIEPYRGQMGSPDSPEGMDAEHFNAYHYLDLTPYGGGTYSRTLYASIREDLLNQETDGWDWFDKVEEDED